jgi:endopeptidase O
MGIHIGYPNKIKPFFSKYKVEKYNEFDKLLLNSLNYIYLASEFKYNEYLKPTDKEY